MISRLTNDNEGEFVVTEIDGKTAYIFESTPAIVFISTDGVGSRDSFYVHGKKITNYKSITIESDPGEVTIYKCDVYACVKEE